MLPTATDMISGRHLEFKNGRREYLNGHISEYNIFTTGEPKLAHMYYVLYRLICNLVPFATDMIYGRHLGFQIYPILVFWQCNPVNLHPNLASTQHTFAKDVLSLLATCEDMGNPFLEYNGDMLTLDTKAKVVMNEDAIRTVNDTVSSFLGCRKKSAWLA